VHINYIFCFEPPLQNCHAHTGANVRKISTVKRNKVGEECWQKMLAMKMKVVQPLWLFASSTLELNFKLDPFKHHTQEVKWHCPIMIK